MISHSKPYLDKDELDKIIEIFNSGMIADGDEIEKFEKDISDYVETKYAVSVSNGTNALYMLLYSMGIKKGDEIIIPASICPGVLHAVEWLNATPVICDTNEYDCNLSAKSVEKMISKNTAAIILPHLFGIPSDIDKFQNKGIPLIEDCAQSIGALYKGKKVGSFGTASIFSFYATKMMTSVDGGMILTDSEKLAECLKDIRYYGGKRDYRMRFNFKLSNLNAAIGRVQLRRLYSFIEKRKKLYDFYVSNFSKYDFIKIIKCDPLKKISSIYRFIIVIEDQIKRNKFIKLCNKHGITLGDAVFVNLGKFAPDYPKDDLRNTEYFEKNAISFPIYPNLERKEFNGFFKELEHDYFI